MLPSGTLLSAEWHKTQEGRQLLATVLHRNLHKLRPLGLLEKPVPPQHLSTAEVKYKILLVGKSGVGKTSTIAKLSGNSIPKTHSETQGIQTTTVYWPGKIIQLNRSVIFQLQFWDAGESSLKKYDHILPACVDKADAMLFLFSFVDRSSFDDIPQQMTKLSNPKDNTSKLVIGTKFDQFEHSEITQRDIRDFENNWKIPILKTRNTPESENMAGFQDITQILNIICEHLWHRDVMLGNC